MSTRLTFVLVFDACVCEGFARRVVVVVPLLAVIVGVGNDRLSLGASFCCTIFGE